MCRRSTRLWDQRQSPDGVSDVSAVLKHRDGSVQAPEVALGETGILTHAWPQSSCPPERDQ